MHFRNSLLLGAALLIAPALSFAQDSSPNQSVADAARNNRDRKKTPATPAKSPKVITDDDLDRRNFKPGQEGLNVGSAPRLETEQPAPEAIAAAEAADKEAGKEALKKAAEEDAQITGLKLQVSQAEKDLDLMQRELSLDSDSYYSKPNYSNDTAGKAKLDAQKSQIADKQQEIERLKTRLAALEELKSHRKPVAGQPPAPAREEKPATNPPAKP